MESENYDDLDELETDLDELSEEFLKHAERAKNFVGQLDDQMLLRLYGYYKQATEGSCNIPKPSWYNMKAKAKWEAWTKLDKMSQTEAKKLYVELVSSLDKTANNSTSKETWVSVSTLQSADKALNESEKSIFDYVKEGNCKEVTSMLKSCNATEPWNQFDDDGIGLIHWAADRGYSDIIAVLLSYGADVNLRDADKQTALHYAAVCGHFDCVDVLLKNNADVTLKDNSGLCPEDVALDSKTKDLLVA